MKNNILFIIHSAGRTGAPLMILNFLKWLKENSDFSFEILIKTTGSLEDEFTRLAPTNLYFQSQHNDRGKTYFSKIKNTLGIKAAKTQSQTHIKYLLNHYRDSGISLIYSNTITNGEILEELAELKCPVITHVHELEYWIYQAGLENLDKIKNQTSRFIAASGAVQKNLTTNHGIPESAIDIIHESIPIPDSLPEPQVAAHVRQELVIPSDAFVVLGSGYESWRKGKDLFVQLAFRVRQRPNTDNVHFLWVGGRVDNEEYYEISHDVKMTGLEEYIHFCGEVNNPLDYFAASDIFALVSREDPYPLVCLEAAMLGKLILCFDNAGGMPEFVEKDAGFVVPYLDIDAMALRVVDMINNKNLRNEIGDKAAQKVREHHDISVAASQIVTVINQIFDS